MNKKSTTIKKNGSNKTQSEKTVVVSGVDLFPYTSTWREKERYDVDDNRIPFYGQRQAKGMPLNANTFLI